MRELHDWGRQKQGGRRSARRDWVRRRICSAPRSCWPTRCRSSRALSRRQSDDGRPGHRPGRFLLADAIYSRALIAEKKLRALALDADKRWDRLPDVPTLDELGFGKKRSRAGSRSPAPPACRRRGQSDLRSLHQASKDPELQKRAGRERHADRVSTPEDMGKAMVQEWKTMQVLAKTLNLRQP